jgi:hypothetical protein
MTQKQVYLVSAEEWKEKVLPRQSIYSDIYEAIDLLKSSPIGTRLKIDAGDDPERKRHRVGTYADRFQIRIRTQIVDGWIYLCSTGRKDKR